MSFRNSLKFLCFRRFILNNFINQGATTCPKCNYITLIRSAPNFPTSSAYKFQNVSSVISSRGYAKGKDKKKGDAKGKKKVQVNDQELSEVIEIENMRNQMQKPLEVLRDEFIKNLSLRSSAGSIETLSVKLDGQDLSLQELAQVVRKNPKTIVINLTTFPQAIPAVLKAIQQSGMNLNPQQDGTTIFVPVPTVTREHRENLARNAKALFIKCRDAVRDVQNKFHRNVKKKTDISEDLSHDVQLQITAIADQYIEQADKMLQAKHVELLGKE